MQVKTQPRLNSSTGAGTRRSSWRLALALASQVALLTTTLSAVRAEAANPLIKAKDKITKTINKPEKPPQLRDKWALVVAVGQFHDSSIRPIKFAQNNALLLSTQLSDGNVGRFGQGHILTITNNKATSINIAKAAAEPWLLKHALPNDLILLYICTRSTPSADGQDILLYGYDTPSTNPEGGSVKLKELLKNIKQRSQSKNIVCLLDLSPATISSVAAEGEKSAEEAAPAPAAGAAPALSLDAIAKETGVAIIAASEPGKRSFTTDITKSSFFMASLLEGLQTGGGLMDLQSIGQYVEQSLKETVAKAIGQEQNPVFALPADDAEIEKTVIGLEVKSSTPPRAVKIGHPIDEMPPPRPAAVSAKPSIKRVDHYNDDDDNQKIGGGSFSDVDFGPYMKKMKRDIQSKWRPPQGFNKQRVVAVFSIKRDGTIANAEIVDGSGNAAVDKSAMKALEEASPLDPLPAGAPSYVQIRYQFDWKVTRK